MFLERKGVAVERSRRSICSIAKPFSCPVRNFVKDFLLLRTVKVHIKTGFFLCLVLDPEPQKEKKFRNILSFGRL